MREQNNVNRSIFKEFAFCKNLVPQRYNYKRRQENSIIQTLSNEVRTTGISTDNKANSQYQCQKLDGKLFHPERLSHMPVKHLTQKMEYQKKIRDHMRFTETTSL